MTGAWLLLCLAIASPAAETEPPAPAKGEELPLRVVRPKRKYARVEPKHSRAQGIPDSEAAEFVKAVLARIELEKRFSNDGSFRIYDEETGRSRRLKFEGLIRNTFKRRSSRLVTGTARFRDPDEKPVDVSFEAEPGAKRWRISRYRLESAQGRRRFTYGPGGKVLPKDPPDAKKREKAPN